MTHCEAGSRIDVPARKSVNLDFSERLPCFSALLNQHASEFRDSERPTIISNVPGFKRKGRLGWIRGPFLHDLRPATVVLKKIWAESRQHLPLKNSEMYRGFSDAAKEPNYITRVGVRYRPKTGIHIYYEVSISFSALTILHFPDDSLSPQSL